MRYIPSILLLPALLRAALAQDDEAEKLYRDMEKKIMAAKSFEVRFDYQIEDRTGKKWKRKTKGTVLLTKENEARLEISGYFRDEPDAPFQLVSDGKQLKTKGARFVVASNGVPGVDQGGQSEQETPKNFHAALGSLMSRGGIWYSLLVMPYLLQEGIDPDAEGSRVRAYDFKLGAAEKVGGREAKVLRYRFGDGGKDGPVITLWVDGKTLQPLKRVFDLRNNKGVVSGIMIIENYNEFTLNPKIDGKAFELPK